MSSQRANEVFYKVYRGQANFMTPRILDRQVTRTHAYEISQGRGMSGETIYGFTVLTLGGERCPELSRLCHSWDEVEDALYELRSEA